ncbi:uncharacterized protein LOC134271072 [Saccostrea cucullata]|uniref:uncharacterized protein LOC134271072 n=1 Tax=Saccostrea cuccullata TaxID=36930 RepID=UPI002ED54F5C
MKIVQASILLFCVSNVAGFGLLRLIKNIMNSQSRNDFRNRGTPIVNSRNANKMDVTYWFNDGDSSSSEEGGFRILNRFDYYDAATDLETTTFSYPKTTTEDDIENNEEVNNSTASEEITNSTTTEQPLITTEAASEEIEISTNPETTQKTTSTPSTTAATSAEEGEVSTTQRTTTSDEKPTTSITMTTTMPITEKSTDGLTTSSTMQTTSSRDDDTRTDAASSTTVAPTTTTSYITTDTFIEGELSIDDTVNTTDLNSTDDDLRKLIEEYNDYFDQGPTRGDLPDNRKTTSQNILATTQSSAGSGIIEASFTGSSTNDASKINIITNSQSIPRDKTADLVDVTSGKIGNIPSDVVIRSLNNKLQVNSQRGQKIVFEKSMSGQLHDTIKRVRNDVISTIPPKPTVFFTPPASQKDIISEPQKNILSERVAKIGNDFVILPDFKNGAILIEPIVPSSDMKSDTISNFDYVPPKTLSYKAIPENV